MPTNPHMFTHYMFVHCVIQIGNVVNHVSKCAKAYHKAAVEFNSASENLTSGLQKAANVLSKDANLKSPLLKVTIGYI